MSAAIVHAAARTETLLLPSPNGPVPIEFVIIRAGKYTRGTPEKEPDREPDENQHPVQITRDFRIGRFEVTNRQFRAFRPDHISGRNADDVSNRDDYPVTFVTWHDANAFCEWASRHTGRSIRLPTEAEWEYAARAGTTTRYSFGDDIAELKDYAWYRGNTGGDAHQARPVGRLKPNPWGLYDIHGNVAEWCFDWYGDYPRWPIIDPQGPPSGTWRVSREGSHGSHQYNCRVGDRDKNEPGFKCDALGFRVVWSSLESEMIVPLPGGVEMHFVYIKPGTFMMGSDESEPIREGDETLHEVTLTRGYWMGKYEVTNRQFRVFRPGHISDPRPNEDFNKDDHPVVGVTWFDCVDFCEWMARKTGRPVRLPTEAEWEYAARAGTTTRFSFGDDVNELRKYAWYRTNVNGRTKPVGLLRPNPWGLYDMHGNAAEWTADWYGPYPAGPVIDPQGPPTGEKRCSREGSGAAEHWNCRSADRDPIEPTYKGTGSGFRVVFTDESFIADPEKK